MPPTRRLPPTAQPTDPRPARGARDGGYPGPPRPAGPAGRGAPGGPADPYSPYGPYPDEPVDEPRRPVSGLRRVVTMCAAVISVMVLAVATTGWGVLRHYDGKVAHVALNFSDASERPASAGGGTQNILLVGSDTRAGTAGEFGQTEGQRSDTTILAHLDSDGSTTLVSFPRDLWVQIPAYTDDDGTEHGPQKSKLNAAFAYGGPSLLIRTIETLTNIRVDHYLQVDFVGFQAITDALGGVTVCVKELPPELKARGFDNLNDRYSGWQGQVGLNVLDGGRALAFVRQRYGLPEGDIDRIRRQQLFLGAVFREVASTGTLLNPNKLLNVVDAATAALTLDENTSLADLRVLAVRMQGISGGGVEFATIPSAPSTVNQQSVLVAKDEEFAALLQRLGGSPPQAAGVAGGSRADQVPRRDRGAIRAVPAALSPALAEASVVPASLTGPRTQDVTRAQDVALARGVTLAQQAPAPAEGVSCTY